MTPVLIPHENVNDESVMIVAWRAASGQRIEKDEVIVEVEGSKAAFEIKAPVAGIVQYSLSAGSEVGVGKAVCQILESDAVSISGNPSPRPIEELQPAVHAGGNGKAVLAEKRPPAKANECAAGNGRDLHIPLLSPDTDWGLRVSAKAAALIAEHGIDRQAFAGRGLITMREVLEFLGKPGATLEPAPPPTAPKPDQSAVAAVGVTYRIEPLSRAKRTEIKYLNSARHAALSSQVSVVVPTAGLRGVAENYPALRGNFTGLFVFETARLLRKYPLFNAFYANDEARIYDEVNIGYAVDAGLGLKVLVVRNADQKTLPAILTEIRDQVVRYLNDELSQADLAGGTFTITDLSGEGVCDFVPLINRGQSAILGVGAENAGPGNSVASFKLILAFDHQLSEGRRAAQFLGDIKTRLIGYEAALRPASNDAAANPAAQLHCAECLMTIQEIESMGGHMLQRVSANGSTGLICTTCAGGF